jgi:hypothetical protein
MKAPGKTSFTRMLLTASAEAERIEISQDEFLRKGDIKVPMLSEARRRDDFAGIVRLIRAIESDAAVTERVKMLMRRLHAADTAGEVIEQPGAAEQEGESA